MMTKTAWTLALTILIVGAGVGPLWPPLSSLGLGSLPGDLFIKDGGVEVYLPLTTGLLIPLTWWIVSKLVERRLA